MVIFNLVAAVEAVLAVIGGVVVILFLNAIGASDGIANFLALGFFATLVMVPDLWLRHRRVASKIDANGAVAREGQGLLAYLWPKSGGHVMFVPTWIFGAVLALLSVLGTGAEIVSPAPLAEASATEAADPRAEDAFRAASTMISVHKDEIAFGNTGAAQALASDFSLRLKVLRTLFFTPSTGKHLSVSDGEFLTYSRLNQDSMVFLVHVPELRHYDAKAQDTLGEAAWEVAQLVVKRLPAPQPTTVAVGIRGAVLYERTLVGTATGAPDVVEGLKGEKRLHAFFVEPERTVLTVDELIADPPDDEPSDHALVDDAPSDATASAEATTDR